MYVSLWAVHKVFSRSFQGHLAFLPPSPFICPVLPLAVLDIWLCGQNRTPFLCIGAMPKVKSIRSPIPHPHPPPPHPPPPSPTAPPPLVFLHCGDWQCSRPAWCGRGGERWQGPEWIADDRWPAGGRRGIPAFLKRNIPTPWLMLGSDFDLYLSFGCQSYSLIVWFACLNLSLKLLL